MKTALLIQSIDNLT